MEFERNPSLSVFTASVFVCHTFDCSAILTMEKLVEQRVCLTFCVSSKILCAEMLQKTYGESCMSKTQAYEWYKGFKESREVVGDLPRFGRPSTSTNNENRQNQETGARKSSYLS